MRFKSRPFNKPILKILQEWKYDDSTDNLGSLDRVYCIVPPPLHEYFIFTRVPFQDTTEQSGRRGRGYLLSKDEAIGWINVLSNILYSFGKGLEGFIRKQNENSLQILVELQKDLVTYLYKAPVVSTIFALPSFMSHPGNLTKSNSDDLRSSPVSTPELRSNKSLLLRLTVRSNVRPKCGNGSFLVLECFV